MEDLIFAQYRISGSTCVCYESFRVATFITLMTCENLVVVQENREQVKHASVASHVKRKQREILP